MKQCRKCGEVKPSFDFYKTKAQCKSCIQTYQHSPAFRKSIKQYQQSEAFKNSQKKYNKNNRDKRNALDAKRRAAKLQATPPWLTKEDLELIELHYLVVQVAKAQGYEFHVDHVIPLQGENVCGLHVPWNLRVIPAKINLSKYNKIQNSNA